ncbi:hypothetical protein [Candidatus Galacturonibacter soehngenii]|uniref:Uncharacterized protein n=1 Tax=Candidatus Galacturonatibacter soehngenii TaxID=2307010 RepID=A0A7V7UFK6_9FIRM|nr:hypothetical protein [Candidatus Galacturonibacter soehngenii]KAB1437576.1 hypothetical protein F7O84_08190 [Candidatus Galacturonibacter soehngenii]
MDNTEILNLNNTSNKPDAELSRSLTVTFEEFLDMVTQLNIAFRGRNALNDKKEIALYWDCLNGFTGEELRKAILEAIKNEKWFPTVSEIQAYLKRPDYDWSFAWREFIKRELPLHKFNKAGQYAVSVVGYDCLWNLIETGKQNIAAREFKEHYERFYIQDIEKQIEENNNQDLFYFEDPEVKRRLEMEQIEKERQEIRNRFMGLDEETRKRLIDRNVFDLDRCKVDMYRADEQDAIALRNVGIDLY